MSLRNLVYRVFEQRKNGALPTLSPSEAYNSWAASYRSRMNPLQELEETALLSLLPDLSGKKVLDVGCGAGRVSRLAVERGAASTVGVDISRAMTDQARLQGQGEWLLADACELPFPESSFDVVVCALVLGHIEHLEKALSEIDRVLNAGGHVVISDFHPFASLSGSKRTFRDPASGRTCAIAHSVHLFEKYFQCFRDHGWVLEAFEEPLYDSYPVAFVLRARKEAAA